MIEEQNNNNNSDQTEDEDKNKDTNRNRDAGHDETSADSSGNDSLLSRASIYDEMFSEEEDDK